MKKIALVVIGLLIFSDLLAQTPVFSAGQEGHKSFRIPAIVGMPNGELLAFAEGRVNGSGECGDINLVLKRSNDQGKTWGSIEVVVNYDALQAGNPAPVVDLTDPRFPQGRIFLFYNTGNNHEGEIRKGNGIREVWYITSTDAGHTWSKPENITSQVQKPNQPTVNPAYNFEEDWRSYANTPGHATQFLQGKYKGRIFVAANHSEGNPKPHFEDYFAHGFYTDDHGKSFHLSETIPTAGGNEATATPLAGSKLMFNARNQKGDIRQRIVAISHDGGKSWKDTYFDPNLPDPVCQGSILGFTSGKQKVLAFSNAADTQNRDNLTLRISFDEGKTWSKSILADKSESSSPRDYTAYSDIVKLSDREIGVLYEKDNYKQIVFKVVSWK